MERNKAIIIENDYEIDNMLRGFLKDNPNLFTEVDEQCACKHRPIEDISQYIPAADSIVICSTFMERRQFQQYVEAFATDVFGKPFKFYIKGFTDELNNWSKTRDDGSYKDDFLWNNLNKMMQYIKLLIKTQEVFSIEKDRTVSKDQMLTDGLCGSPCPMDKRYPFIVKRIRYDSEIDVFYNEGDNPKVVKENIW